ncbi:hypothetical protein AK812_SmicGene22482 [Symbiodinium microadriaticum]|uniref:Uncharacterized protein n=1 Tax=Symbiodinium microadriaticum TaxID=2951 RepID=A0A1Q9DJR1_SYMMI|nr:hypothetical protein AK812_SmicGene22482 [Symbiodinium microadriaticum]
MAARAMPLVLAFPGVASRGNVSLAPRRLQDTYTFLTSQLNCQMCCEEEWRSCLCMLSCDIFQGECDGVEEVETCNVVRACYRRIDDASPRGFDFEWQCRLMKCISYCLRHAEVCEPIRNDFVADCNRGREGELHACDVVCSRVRPSALLPWTLLAFLVIACTDFSWHPHPVSEVGGTSSGHEVDAKELSTPERKSRDAEKTTGTGKGGPPPRRCSAPEISGPLLRSTDRQTSERLS